jgi:hypothetical protein
MLGILGVTEIEGTMTGRPLVGTEESLPDMLGNGRMVPRDDVLIFGLRTPSRGALTEMDGVSETEIDGKGDL